MYKNAYFILCCLLFAVYLHYQKITLGASRPRWARRIHGN